eukprot:tig00020539_g10436.t1
MTFDRAAQGFQRPSREYALGRPLGAGHSGEVLEIKCHPNSNVVKEHDAFFIKRGALYETYIVMEKCDGTLSDLTGSRRRLSEFEIRSVLAQLASALHHIHSTPIAVFGEEGTLAHCDLKAQPPLTPASPSFPDNVFFIECGGRLEVKLGDFGTSRVQPRGTLDAGSPARPVGSSPAAAALELEANLAIAPELEVGLSGGAQCDWRAADVYGLGAVARALCAAACAGADPVEAGGWEASYSAGLVDLIRDLMDSDPARRPSAKGALDRLELAAGAGAGAPALRAASPRKAAVPEPPKRNSKLKLAAAVSDGHAYAAAAAWSGDAAAKPPAPQPTAKRPRAIASECLVHDQQPRPVAGADGHRGRIPP